MKKNNEEIVNSTFNLHSEMNNLTQDEIVRHASSPVEPEVQVETLKQKALRTGALWIEPKRKMPCLGTLPEKWKKDREYDWEYVQGIYENQIIDGEPESFWFVKWPGDPDCLWEVPCNRPVYVPRMIAHHLSGEVDRNTGLQAQVYHTFDYVEKPAQQCQKNEFTHAFRSTGTHYRGKFRPVGAFA